MYENAFKSIDGNLRAEEGMGSELEYVEQTSWVLFLKYLRDLEVERQDRAELSRGGLYTSHQPRFRMGHLGGTPKHPTATSTIRKR